MGRLLYVVFDDSNLFGSRKPSASVPYPSFCDAETKATFPVSYNSITISTPRLPRESTVGPASAYSGSASTTHSSLMMEAARTSETSVDNHFTRQYNPEDSSEQSYCLFRRSYMSMESHGGMTFMGKIEELGEMPAPVPLSPPKIPYGLTRALTLGLLGDRPVTNRLSHGTALFGVNELGVLAYVGYITTST
jgi:hypothetical protein